MIPDIPFLVGPLLDAPPRRLISIAGVIAARTGSFEAGLANPVIGELTAALSETEANTLLIAAALLLDGACTAHSCAHWLDQLQ